MFIFSMCCWNKLSLYCHQVKVYLYMYSSWIIQWKCIYLTRGPYKPLCAFSSPIACIYYFNVQFVILIIDNKQSTNNELSQIPRARSETRFSVVHRANVIEWGMCGTILLLTPSVLLCFDLIWFDLSFNIRLWVQADLTLLFFLFFLGLGRSSGVCYHFRLKLFIFIKAKPICCLATFIAQPMLQQQHWST